MAARPQTLLVCGLAREGKLAAGPQVVVVPSGGRRAVLEDRLAAIDSRELGAVVSFGLAGALDPTLTVGDVLVPAEVRMEDGSRFATSAELTKSWLEGEPVASREPILGLDAPAATAAAKAALRARSGAVAVDMESHLAAAYAARRGLPFGILRVVSDGADRTIPPAAIAAMREDGGIDVAAVLTSLARRPGQIPALVATARDGARAFDKLGRVGGLLRLVLGLHLR